MANQARDFEDRLKLQVHQSTLRHRRAICEGCEYKGQNGFCQKNYSYLIEYTQFRYNACPLEKWKENW